MAFYTITLASDLTAEDHRRAVRAGPPAVSSRHNSAELLRRAGFEKVSVTDVTSPYLETARSGMQARDRHRTELERDGCATFAQGQRNNRSAVAAIEAGWLRRQFLTAARPDPLP